MLRLFAWLGGALFLASLFACGWFIGVVLARPRAAGAGFAGALGNIALFSVFATHHSLLARSGVKARLAAWLPADAERVAYVWTASLLLLAVCALWQPLAGTVWVASPWLGPALRLLQLLGLVLTVYAAATVGVLELAGIRQALRRPRGDEAFRARGPFAWVRHPIYLGWMLIVFAMPVMTTGGALFAAVSSLYLLLAIPWEERSLIRSFGEPYRAYQRAVRWRVLPGVW